MELNYKVDNVKRDTYELCATNWMLFRRSLCHGNNHTRKFPRHCRFLSSVEITFDLYDACSSPQRFLIAATLASLDLSLSTAQIIAMPRVNSARVLFEYSTENKGCITIRIVNPINSSVSRYSQQ